MSAPLRVCVVGALGRMGERVRAAVAEAPDADLTAALEASDHPGLGSEVASGVRVGDDPKAALGGADVVIDFSTPSSTLAVLRAAVDAGVPCVVGTTGFTAEQHAEVEALAARIPILLAANFSRAVNTLIHLVGEAARILGDAYDVEIVELHHAAKRDAPSGTALRLAEAVAEARGTDLGQALVRAREGETGARRPGTIGVQALRGGDNPGEHTVLFVGRGERLELSHRAATRDHFARGALEAARWLHGRTPGLYGGRSLPYLPSGGPVGETPGPPEGK